MLETLHFILSTQVLDASLAIWALFFTVVGFVLFLDLGVLNRKDHEIGVKESLWFSLIYVILACLVGGWVWLTRGAEDGVNYFTAYFVEQSLSLDNLFVMSLIFIYYGIPRLYQHRVLFWGVVGVVVLRGIMIGTGTSLIHRFAWVSLLFAAFLIFTGIKMVLSDDEDDGIENSKMLRLLQRYFSVTPFLRGNHFFIYQKTGSQKPGASGGWQATPLFLALVTIELADVVFAVDSVPAVLSITNDTFVVYASNIFAVLGLRTMYFAVAALIHRFQYMKYALSLILVFIGAKGFYNHFGPAYGMAPISPATSLCMTLGLLAAGVAFSLFKTRATEKNGDAKAASNDDLLGPG